MRKIGEKTYPPPSFEEKAEDVEGHIPAHRDFRDKYFKKFGKDLIPAETVDQPDPRVD